MTIGRAAGGAWHTRVLASTPPGMPGTHPPQYFGWRDVNGNIPQYYYVLSGIADQHWLPSVRSASSRFHSAIRRHQFASVPSHAPPHSMVRHPNLELALERPRREAGRTQRLFVAQSGYVDSYTRPRLLRNHAAISADIAHLWPWRTCAI